MYLILDVYYLTHLYSYFSGMFSSLVAAKKKMLLNLDMYNGIKYLLFITKWSVINLGWLACDQKTEWTWSLIIIIILKISITMVLKHYYWIVKIVIVLFQMCNHFIHLAVSNVPSQWVWKQCQSILEQVVDH